MLHEFSAARIAQALPHMRRFFPTTPAVEAHALSAAVDARVWLKLESTTPVRTFKVRGALNRLRTLAEQGTLTGVATASAGNHGLGVAWAARQLGVPALVVVPAAANPTKVALLQTLGAEVQQHGIDYFAAFEHMQGEAASRGWPVLHAYDDLDVIAGQGTIGLELLEQVPEMDCVVMGVGGGGLMTGVATAIKATRPDVRIVGVQMAGADSMARSLAAGVLTPIAEVRTMADGLSTRAPGVHNFALAQRLVDEVAVIPDEALWPAMSLLLRAEHQVVEPAGAAATAALLHYGASRFGRQPVAIVSGANIADTVLRQVCGNVTR